MALSEANYQRLSDPQFNKSLFATGLQLSKNRTTAEDLVQQTIVKILENQEKFQEGTNFQGWANTILRNTFFSLNRKRKREILSGGDAGDENDPLSQALNYQAVSGNQIEHLELEETLKALDHLVPEHREAIDLIFVEQMSYEEAAQQLDVAVGTVKSRVFRARAHLAEIMEDPQAFNISLSPRDAGVNTLSRKVGTLIEGFYTAPTPQKLSLPQAPKSQPVRRLESITSYASLPKAKPARVSAQSKYIIALSEALKLHEIDESPLESDKFSEIITAIGARSNKQLHIVLRVLEGKDFTSIAAEDGITVPGVTQHLKAAIKNIEKYDPKGDAEKLAAKELKRQKNTEPKPQKETRPSKYRIELNEALKKQGIEDDPLNSSKFSEIMAAIAVKNEKQSRVVIDIVMGKSLYAISREQSATSSAVIGWLKGATKKIDNYNPALAVQKRTTKKIKHSKSSKSKSVDKPRHGKYRIALNEALKKQGIEGKPLDSSKFNEIMTALGAKSEKQKQTIIDILHGKDLNTIAREEGASLPTIYSRTKAAIRRIENYKAEADVKKFAIQKLKQPKNAGFKPVKGQRQGKYHIALKAALKKQGIEGDPRVSDKFSEIITAIGAKSDKQKHTVISILEGKSFAAIARLEGTSVPSIIIRLKTAIKNIENYNGGVVKQRPKAVFVKASNENKSPSTPEKSFKPYHRALRQAFANAGIEGNPMGSEKGQELINATFTSRQKDTVGLVLNDQSLSDIARKFNISSASVSITFKAALERLENPSERAITREVEVDSQPKSVKATPLKSKQYTKYHYDLRDVLIRQGITGNPLESEKFNYLLSMRLTAIQQDTVRQIISGASLEDIAKDYRVGKAAVTARLKQAIDKLSLKSVSNYKNSAIYSTPNNKDHLDI